ncbi:hypothetical protein TVAG_489890 [Trichomonas vaginalis G3]|uniref:Glycosyltransferase 61 catalytic domain-containing protein n=1 Tax=Trichomonas vaginalis (strain ATCC PRA-98 / G3) TaxID=412133 RepID=A2FQ78_TRIV3|nr:glycosyltransferase family [Trichomonas vaginalis G3]EAX92950.1 hypothetical protein TVAG_489890 [Trichomonas vaginalis G3]KAI5553160.1 glycosyltransferase family [Trichomonas vaginalis G3]|eukprot:XP_001305880.1 hypothetical protein [Trichomonas vaginalis G3]
MRSIVYVATYENTFLARIPAFYQIGILPHDEFYTDKLRLTHNTVGNCLYAVFYIQEYPMFGHLIHDFLASMMFVPEYVNKSGFTVIAPRSGKEIADIWCKYLGINANIVSLAENEQIQAAKLFLISGRKAAHSVTVGGIKRLRKYIEERLNLSNIIPTKYVLGNRPKSAYRSILHIDKLYESLKKINENFVLHENEFDNLEENAKFWSDIRIYVGPCGSNIYNSVFMRENTGLCLLFSHMDLPNVHLCITSNFYMIGLVQQCFRKDNFEKYDIQLFLRYVKSVIYCVDNKRWPSDIDIDSPLVSRFKYEYNDPLPDIKAFVGS